MCSRLKIAEQYCKRLKTGTTKIEVTMKSRIGNINKKLEKLKETFLNMGSVLVAYSGGADSTFLLKVAKDVLDDKVLAVTATSLTYPSYEIENAKKMAERLCVRHLTIETFEFSNPKFTNNSQDRCYWCKRELFLKLAALAKEYKLNHVLDGSNYDDKRDFRPGMKAAEEMGVRSPLYGAGITKEEIRFLSQRLGLLTWDKPSFACLASRVPYGTPITRKLLGGINRAEEFLLSLGLEQVRVRHHDKIARIEVLLGEMEKVMHRKKEIAAELKSLGYVYIVLDLEGYRSGSLNLVLDR